MKPRRQSDPSWTIGAFGALFAIPGLLLGSMDVIVVGALIGMGVGLVVGLAGS